MKFAHKCLLKETLNLLNSLVFIIHLPEGAPPPAMSPTGVAGRVPDVSSALPATAKWPVPICTSGVYLEKCACTEGRSAEK